MKTYLLDSLERFKRYSESLDAKTIICNKTWIVFNDNGIKEIYIFQEDGDLIISCDGIVTNGKWKYIPANKSLIISGNDQSYMLHPKFYDGIIFALLLDGTKEYSFMIDETNSDSFRPKTRQELLDYFDNKQKTEEKKIKEEKRNIRIEQKRNKEIELVRQRLLNNDTDYVTKKIIGDTREKVVNFLQIIIYVLGFLSGLTILYILNDHSFIIDEGLDNEIINLTFGLLSTITTVVPFGAVISILLALVFDFIGYPITFFTYKKKIRSWYRNNPNTNYVNVIKNYSFKYHIKVTPSITAAVLLLQTFWKRTI